MVQGVSDVGRVRALSRPRTDLSRLASALWLLAFAAGAAGLLTCRYLEPLPWACRAIAAAVTVLLTIGIVHRCGGPVFGAALVSAVCAGAAAATGWSVLLAGAAIAVAVMGGALALLATKPAADFLGTVREVAVATVLAVAGGLAADAYGAHLDASRYGYCLVAGTIGLIFLVVYRLGAGFHGLGRRGYAVTAGALIVLVVAIAYSEALGTWGPHQWVDGLHDARRFLRGHLGGVPMPLGIFLGTPALCWGVFMRARRRQGWWVAAFGAALTAPVAAAMSRASGAIGPALLGTAYSLLPGLLLGYLVIRAEQRLTGSRGRRARRVEEADAHRPEPGRLAPLR